MMLSKCYPVFSFIYFGVCLTQVDKSQLTITDIVFYSQYIVNFEILCLYNLYYKYTDRQKSRENYVNTTGKSLIILFLKGFWLRFFLHKFLLF